VKRPKKKERNTIIDVSRLFIYHGTERKRRKNIEIEIEIESI